MTWIDDLEATTAIDPHFVLVGHTWDFVVDGADGATVRALPVLDRLVAISDSAGMSFVVVADPALGFSIIELVDGVRAQLPDPLTTMRLHHEPSTGKQDAPTPAQLGDVIQVVAESATLGAVLVPDGGRWIVDVANLQPEEHRLFARSSALARASIAKPGRDERAAHSAIWWLCRDDTELPSWYLADPCVRLIPVAGPTRGERARLGAALLGVDARDEQAHEFADATDGMAVRSLLPVADLVDDGQRVQDAATLVRLGVTDDPWRSDELLERVHAGREQLGQRVLGQDHALDKAWMGLTRSLSGLSGVHRPSSGRRPRLVLFLAGPTGVGKTELAKAIAELIFGSKDAILRFDMSGYREPHTAQGLIGAPPGYVGHEGGGTLTNRVRERPFSVILFDEIEKAHPRIFDTFLQVLDEGHLDDGRGIRTYFDQSVIIFTSNLGIVDAQGDELVTADMEPDEIRVAVEQHIRRYFREDLSRPELLNRLGDAFAVFDFIRPPVDQSIFQMLVDNVVAGTKERLGLGLGFEDEALAQLRDHCCADLSMGGRGIGNMVEASLVNPLSRWTFDQMLAGTLPADARVVAWELVDGQPSLRIEAATSPLATT